MSEPFARLFFYGSLLDTEVLSLVVERPVAAAELRAARLDGFQRVRLLHDSYPMLVPVPGAAVEGAVFDLAGAREFERVRFFEADEYRFEACTVHVADGRPLAAQFCAEAAMPGGALGEWCLEEWRRAHKTRYLRQARRFMSAFGHMSPAEADHLWHQHEPAELARRA